jgi:YfiH family protein
MISYCRLKIRKNENFAEIPLTTKSNDGEFYPFMAAISLKKAGDMGFPVRNKLPHRRALFSIFKISGESVFTLNQNHTRKVFRIKANNKPSDFEKKKGDGFVTSLSWPILGVTVADCLPLLLLSKDKKTYGLVHSGFQGTGIVESALAIFVNKLKIKPESILAWLGPAIGSCCYLVDSVRAADFALHFGENTVENRLGHYYINLRQANINLLKKWGVKYITVVEDCTSCSEELSSFRRDGKDNFSRMLVLFGPLKKDDKEFPCSITE